MANPFWAQLQKEHPAWVEKQGFAKTSPADAVFGMIEEAREYRKSGLFDGRRHEEYREKAMDAVGDFVIFLCQFCNEHDLSLEAVIEDFGFYKPEPDPDLARFYRCYSQNIKGGREKNIRFICMETRSFLAHAYLYLGDRYASKAPSEWLREIVKTTWENTVSKRENQQVTRAAADSE